MILYPVNIYINNQKLLLFLLFINNLKNLNLYKFIEKMAFDIYLYK